MLSGKSAFNSPRYRTSPAARKTCDNVDGALIDSGRASRLDSTGSASLQYQCRRPLLCWSWYRRAIRESANMLHRIATEETADDTRIEEIPICPTLSSQSMEQRLSSFKFIFDCDLCGVDEHWSLSVRSLHARSAGLNFALVKAWPQFDTLGRLELTV